jgi:hypothetical protein
LVLTSFNVVRGRYFAPDVKPEDVVLLQDGKPRGFSTFEGPGTGQQPPLELVLLFDTSTFPPPGSGTGTIDPARLPAGAARGAGSPAGDPVTLFRGLTRWDREAVYDFTKHWGDQESRAILEKDGADLRVSVYRYDHQQMQLLCRSAKDAGALTSAMHRLLEPMAGDNLVPLTLPPGRMTFDDYAAKNHLPRPSGAVVRWPVSWTMEALIAALKDSVTTPTNAIRVLAVFSEGGASKGDGPGGGSPTTTTAEDAAAQANALGIAVYPVVLDSEEYKQRPNSARLNEDGSLTPNTDPPLFMVWFSEVGAQTGGEDFWPARIDGQTVDGILEQIKHSSLSRYLVGFAPEPSEQRRPHKLEVRLKPKASGKVVGGKRTAVY